MRRELKFQLRDTLSAGYDDVLLLVSEWEGERRERKMMMMKNVFMTCLYFYILFSSFSLSFSSLNVLVMFIKSVSHTQVWMIEMLLLLSSKILFDNHLKANLILLLIERSSSSEVLCSTQREKIFWLTACNVRDTKLFFSLLKIIFLPQKFSFTFCHSPKMSWAG